MQNTCRIVDERAKKAYMFTLRAMFRRVACMLVVHYGTTAVFVSTCDETQIIAQIQVLAADTI